MYEELVKRLREHNGWALNETLDQAADAIENTSKAYEMMAEAYEAEVTKSYWIPVTERLPEEKTYVLILADTIAGKMEKVSFLYKDGEGRNCWTALDVYGKNPFDWQPTHWMYLPKLPKGEDNEHPN